MRDYSALLKRVGVSGIDKPKRTPSHPTKSHVVVTKVNGKPKTIRFGQQGVSGAGKSQARNEVRLVDGLSKQDTQETLKKVKVQPLTGLTR